MRTVAGTARLWLGLCLCTLLIGLNTINALCPGSPWREWRGNCYRLTYEKVPWHGVRGDCKAFFRSSDVASIQNRREYNFVKRLARRQPVWIGLRSVSGRLSWVDGAPVTFDKLRRRGQPKGLEEVVRMDKSGQWDFVEPFGSTQLNGVCKMPSCSCPPGWVAWDRRCYRAVTQRVSWTEARQRCRQLEPTADLVSIINNRENNFVFNLLKTYPFWIGLNDREKEGEFVWSSGEKYPFTKWHPPTEPNGANHKQDCAEMLNDRTWSDSTCTAASWRLNPFVCEMIVCGRDKVLPKADALGNRIRLWDQSADLRCPEGWRRAGDRCYNSATQPDTFARLQSQCSDQHPSARIALMRSIDDNDHALFAAGEYPVWIDYGSRASRSLDATSLRLSQSQSLTQDASQFTHWEPDSILSRSVDSDCATLQRTGRWRPGRCNRDRLPGLCELPACKPVCPGGWSEFQGHCYQLVEQKLKRDDAAATCRQQGGTLASIQSQEENDFVETMAFPSGPKYSGDERYVWLSATRSDGAADWLWADCAPWTMARWQRGDGNGPDLTNGTCAALSISARWRDDLNCRGDQFRSVCELDPCLEVFGGVTCRGGKEMGPETSGEVEEVTVSPGQPSNFLCPPDWTRLKDRCYLVSAQAATFLEALQTCTVTYHPANVASVHSQEENNLILSMTGGQSSWLGLTGVYNFPRWEWLDGSPADFLAWASGEPTASVQNGKMCSVVGTNGQWEAQTCTDQRHRFICSLPAARLVVDSKCPDRELWRDEGGSCYMYQKEGKQYRAANMACHQLSGGNFTSRLVVVKNAQQEAVLQRLANGHVVRLGLSNDWPEGEWLWEDGTAPSYTNWLRPPPNGSRKWCAVLDSRQGRWLAQECNDNVPYFCEAVEGADDYADYGDYGDYGDY